MPSEPGLNLVDDSNGSVGDFSRRACKDLGTVVLAARPIRQWNPMTAATIQGLYRLAYLLNAARSH